MTVRTITQSDRDKSARLAKLWKAKKRDLHLTQREVAERLGYKSQSMVSMQLAGDVALNTEAVLRWASLLRVQPSEIDPALSMLSFSTIPITATKVPVLVRLSGGPVGPFESVEVHGHMKKQMYGVSVDTTGFEPFAKEGSTLFVSRDEEPVSGDRVFVGIQHPTGGQLHLLREYVTTDLSRSVVVVRDLATGELEELDTAVVSILDPIVSVQLPAVNRPTRIRPTPL